MYLTAIGTDEVDDTDLGSVIISGVYILSGLECLGTPDKGRVSSGNEDAEVGGSFVLFEVEKSILGGVISMSLLGGVISMTLKSTLDESVTRCLMVRLQCCSTGTVLGSGCPIPSRDVKKGLQPGTIL